MGLVENLKNSIHPKANFKREGKAAQQFVEMNPLNTLFIYIPGFMLIIICIIALFSNKSICQVGFGDLLNTTKPTFSISINENKSKILPNLYTDGNNLRFDISGRLYLWGPSKSQQTENQLECNFSLQNSAVNIDNLSNGNNSQRCYIARGVGLYMMFVDTQGVPVNNNLYYQTVALNGLTGSNNLTVNDNNRTLFSNSYCENPLDFPVNCFDKAHNEDRRMFSFSFNVTHPDVVIPKKAQLRFHIAHFQKDANSIFYTPTFDDVKMPNADGTYNIYIKGGMVDEAGAAYIQEEDDNGRNKADGIVSNFEEFIYGDVKEISLESAKNNAGFLMTSYRYLVNSSLNTVFRAMMMFSLILIGFNTMLGFGSFNAHDIIIWILKLSVCIALSSPSDNSLIFFYRFVVHFSQVLLGALSSLANNIFIALNNTEISGGALSDLENINFSKPSAGWLREVDLMLSFIISNVTIAKIGILGIGYFPLGIIAAYFIIGMAFKIVVFCVKVIMMYASSVIQLGLLLVFTPFMVPFILFNATETYLKNWLGKIKKLYIELAVIVLMSKIIVNGMLLVYVGALGDVKCPWWMWAFGGWSNHLSGLILLGLLAPFLGMTAFWGPIILGVVNMLTNGDGIVNWATNDFPILTAIKSLLLVTIFSKAFDKLVAIGNEMTGGGSKTADMTGKAMSEGSKIKKAAMPNVKNAAKRV